MRWISVFVLLLPLWGAERIVTLSPALSEIVFALGAGDDLVGVSSYATYPERVNAITRIGGFFDPDLERILALRPTLVLVQEHHEKTRLRLEALGIRTLHVKLESYEDIRSDIATIGEALGRRAEAAALIKSIDTAAQNAPKVSDNPSVLILFGSSDDLSGSLYIAGKTTFLNTILDRCGAHNAYNGPLAQPRLELEQLIALNPDIVLIFQSRLTHPESDIERLKKRWSHIPIKAAHSGRIHILQDEALLIPSQRVSESLVRICETLRD